MPVLIKGSGGKNPIGTKTITANDTYDVTDYASVKVAVPVNTPSGTKNITANGTYDVSSYASAKVAVPEPSGTKTITENGTHDVKNYANVTVNVPVSSPTDFSKLRIFPIEHITPMGETVIKFSWGQELWNLDLTASDIKQILFLHGHSQESGGLAVEYDILWDSKEPRGRRRCVDSGYVTGSYTQDGYISSVAFDDNEVLVYLESGVLYEAENTFDFAYGSIVVELY